MPFTWLELDTWIIVTGIACALACAIPGTLLVLRQMSMMGDAISHTVLPGIAIAFIVTQSRDPMPMFIGAIVIGIATAVFVEWVRDLGKTDGGTAMGIVFTTLFAAGLILLRQGADSVDLDPGCVLYGAVETVASDTMTLLGITLPRPAIINGLMFVVNALAVTIFYKEFKISSFDPALATTMGINARVMHYLLMVLTAATAVAAFETVGSILVIAMLIVPPAAAYLLTDRFGLMFILAGVIGSLAAAIGHIAAITLPPLFSFGDVQFGDTVTSGMMAFAAGFLFLLCWLFAPKQGLIAKQITRSRLQYRMLIEDILGILYRAEEMDGGVAPCEVPRSRLQTLLFVRSFTLSFGLRMLQRSRDIAISRTGHHTYSLTEAGRVRARQLVRSHRLWETYLVAEASVQPDHTHRSAHDLEHLPSELADRLSEALGNPTIDPDGKVIPPT